jgi:hypothetical protein
MTYTGKDKEGKDKGERGEYYGIEYKNKPLG